MRTHVSIILLVIALVNKSCAKVSNPFKVNLPKAQSAESRIVGGSEVTPHSVPHQAALFIDGQYICGGSLISETWVLTSADCVNPYSTRSIEVTLGAHNINIDEETQQKINSSSILLHPNFNFGTKQNNIALIKLETPAELNANVSAVCLVESNIKIDNGKTMIATGYGKTSDSSNANFSPVLRSVSALTISNKQCSETFAIAADDDGMMCTSADGGRGVCTGDEGGPLTISGVYVDGSPNRRQCQVGISSYVLAPCQAGSPTLFTRVSSYMEDFIVKNTGIRPCKECSGSNIVYPSIVALLCSLVFLFQFKTNP